MRSAIVLPGLVAIGGLLGLASSAHATLQIAIQVGTAKFFCADNTSCDQNSAPNILQLKDQKIGGVIVNTSIQNAFSSKGLDFLTAGSTSVINSTGKAVNIEVTVSATNFVGPVGSVATTGSGSWLRALNSNVALTWFDDPANKQGARFAGNTPGNLVDSFTSTATSSALQSFSHDFTGTVSDTGPFSMTLNAVGTLQAHAQLLSRGQGELKTSVVPEPGSLSLLGLGLGLIALSRRRS
jgi:hypothetical protein